MSDNLLKSNKEWKEQLPDTLYRVAREKGTEAPFTGKLLHEKRPGLYVCACCDAPLFESSTKFDSGSGWPSFYQPAFKGAVVERQDAAHGMIRTEITCAKCGAHLGHVFSDGPAPTGERYCINSVSLALKPEEK